MRLAARNKMNASKLTENRDIQSWNINPGQEEYGFTCSLHPGNPSCIDCGQLQVLG